MLLWKKVNFLIASCVYSVVLFLIIFFLYIQMLYSYLLQILVLLWHIATHEHILSIYPLLYYCLLTFLVIFKFFVGLSCLIYKKTKIDFKFKSCGISMGQVQTIHNTQIIYSTRPIFLRKENILDNKRLYDPISKSAILEVSKK